MSVDYAKRLDELEDQLHLDGATHGVAEDAISIAYELLKERDNVTERWRSTHEQLGRAVKTYGELEAFKNSLLTCGQCKRTGKKVMHICDDCACEYH